MGRRRLHDQDTALALLDAAEKIVETEGLTALTVRSVADAVGTTTRAVYSTLGSKPALIGALGARAFDILADLVRSTPAGDDPDAALISAGLHGFRPFAIDHPALFRVGVQQNSVPPEAFPAISTAAASAMTVLHERVERLQAADRLGGRSVSEATWQFHCLCEGLAAVELRCDLAPEESVRMWDDALASLIYGWRRPM